MEPGRRGPHRQHDCRQSGKGQRRGPAGAAGTTTLTACTISDNSADADGGGLFDTGSSTTTLADTIVAGNSASTADPDVDGTVSSASAYDLFGTGGSGGISNGSNGNIVLNTSTEFKASNPAGLSALGDYGGLTDTIALLPGSPAIAAGTTITGVTTDQRGLLRGNTVDIGTFQTSLVVESKSGTVVTSAAGLTLAGTVSLADEFAGTAITFDASTGATFTTARTITLAGSASS